MALGVKYQPSNPDLMLVNMHKLWQTSNSEHVTLTEAVIEAKTPIAERAQLFAPLDKLVTKTINMYESTKALKQLKSNAKTLADRVRGAQKVKKEDNPGDVSVSHQGYVQKQDYFNQLVTLYTSDAKYAPNETDMQTATLQTYSDAMKEKNDGIGTILEPVANLLISRDKALYGEETGMIDVAQAAKDYVQGVWGARSPEAVNIRKISFKRPKKK